MARLKRGAHESHHAAQKSQCAVLCGMIWKASARHRSVHRMSGALFVCAAWLTAVLIIRVAANIYMFSLIAASGIDAAEARSGLHALIAIACVPFMLVVSFSRASVGVEARLKRIPAPRRCIRAVFFLEPILTILPILGLALILPLAAGAPLCAYSWAYYVSDTAYYIVPAMLVSLTLRSTLRGRKSRTVCV